MHCVNRVRPSFGSIISSGRFGRFVDVEHLESRTLLTATVIKALPSIYVPANSSATSVNLDNYFEDNEVPGKFVLMQTNEGEIPIALSSTAQIATTVNNFVNYVESGTYNDTIFHRVITDAQGGIGIVQGGGYTTSLSPIVATNAAIPLQYDLPNAQYTIAMARTSVQNSATTGWFFNAIDNTQALGSSNGGGYAVFGNALYNVGAATINAIYGLQQVSVTTTDGQTQTNFPVNSNYTSGTPTSSDYVDVESAAVVSPLTFGASTNNNQIVTPSIASSGALTLNYTGQTGTATIDVSAQDYGGTVVTGSFNVQVGGTPPGPVVTLGKGGARMIKFTDPNGVAGTATLTGPGSATVDFVGFSPTASSIKGGVQTITGTPQYITFATSGTTAGSALNINGKVSLASITTSAAIGSINGTGATLAGDLTAAGTVGTINLGSANSGTISVGAAGRSLNLKVGSASSEAVSATGAIASITAKSWTSGGAISATAINRITDTGELNAEIDTPTVGQVMAGSITASTWSISGKLAGITAGSITQLNLDAGIIGPITDRGTAQTVAITSTGSIGAIRALGMSGTRIEAGVDTSDDNGLATAFSANDKIASVTIGKSSFSNSVIDAETLSRVSLGALSSSNGGTPFGLASSDIVSLTATIDGKRVTISRATSAAVVTAALTKAGVTLTDMVIRIV